MPTDPRTLVDLYRAGELTDTTHNTTGGAMEYTMTDLYNAVLHHSGLTGDELREVADHGADAGWAGFTYYRETTAFMDAHGDIVWAMVADQAMAFGVTTMAHIASFGCAEGVESQAGLDNALAWWALETVAEYVANGDES